MRTVRGNITKADRVVKGTSRVALDFLFSLEQDELHRLLISGVPERVFSSLSNSFGRDELVELAAEEEHSYSGLTPHIYLYEKVKATDAIASSSQGLWKLAQELYTNPAFDQADLSAWAEDGFPFSLKRVSRQFLLKRARISGVIALPQKSNQLALASFRQLHA